MKYGSRVLTIFHYLSFRGPCAFSLIPSLSRLLEADRPIRLEGELTRAEVPWGAGQLSNKGRDFERISVIPSFPLRSTSQIVVWVI